MGGISIVDEIDFGVFDGGGVVAEMDIHEARGGLADIFAIIMSADADEAVDPIARAEEAIKTFEPVADAFVGVHGKDRVLVAIDEEHRSGPDQGGDEGPVPLIGIVEKHAVAMAVDDAV